MEIQESSPTNNIIVGNFRLSRAERWEKYRRHLSPSQMLARSSQLYSRALQLPLQIDNNNDTTTTTNNSSNTPAEYRIV